MRRNLCIVQCVAVVVAAAFVVAQQVRTNNKCNKSVYNTLHTQRHKLRLCEQKSRYAVSLYVCVCRQRAKNPHKRTQYIWRACVCVCVPALRKMAI